ncbi:hypothetical protein [Chryseobacterium oryzae]|uniref:Lipoprotein n=1 Tax=Chryseobacterium oryzae TaxID=2929799 RepID=A0ABY4BD71_9FLAO|nr:hypothetical protein [Chryseobacterium oryzae]UOE37020.1 hypothetical protein MTP08_08040 [Chryseobacterium oryzae]
MSKKIVYIFLLFFIISCEKNDKKEIENKQIEIWNNRISAKPQILSFIFQPALNENCEIIIDINRKNLIFRSIYPERIIEPKPNNENEINEYNNPANPKSYVSKLDENQIKILNIAINKLEKKDFNRIEKTYVDGISYNFSIIYSDNTIKNGNIAGKKTTNQNEFVDMLLSLISETNKYPENTKIINYYYKFQ